MKQDVFNYALNFPGENTSSVFKFGANGINLSTGRPGDSVELRFKLTDADTYASLPTHRRKQILYSSENEVGGIRARWSGSGNETNREGYVDIFYQSGSSYVTQSVGPAPIYNGDWWSLIYQRTSGSNSDNIVQTYETFLKQKDFDGIDREYSSSYVSNNTAYNTKNILRGTDLPMSIGGMSASNDHGNMFSGELQEFRIYSNALDENIFNGHVLSPLAYSSNSPTGSYYDLGFRLRFGTEPLEWDHSIYSIVSSSQPNTDIKYWNGGSDLLVATGSGWQVSSSSYSYNEEDILPVMPVVLGLSPVQDQIVVADETPQIKNSDGTVLLSRESSVVKKSNELTNPAASKVGIYFSPTNEINNDIMNHMGGFKLDDIIGDPGEIYSDEYQSLRNFRNEYFKKIKQKYDYVDYFNIVKYYDTSLFRTLQGMFDSKTKSLTGVVVEPHILERSKVKTLNERPTFENLEYETDLHCSKSITGEYAAINISGSLKQSPDISTQYLQQYTASISNIAEIDSFYNEEYNSEIIIDTSDFVSGDVPNTTIDGSETTGELGDNIELSNTSPIFLEGTSKFFTDLSFTHSDVSKSGFALATPTRSLGAQYYIGQQYLRGVLESVTGSRKTDEYQITKGFFITSNYNVAEMNISASMGNYESSSFEPAEYIPPFEESRIRSKWEGSKITSPDWNRAATNSNEGTVNINGSQDTPDGGPVVEIFKADPNKMVFKPTTDEGNFTLMSEAKRKTLKEQKNTINPFSLPLDLFKKLLDNRRRNL